ncbi:PH domain-containing protein [Streptacidiphilus cavernicola]|uniref:PH domain-containing protein n=1 Tax=Streptacidiphilus cavernicola TaxID=3342716 RepID=A0ABV6VTB8_9ACTN
MSDPQGDNPSGHSAAGQETPVPSSAAADRPAADRPADRPADQYADRIYRSMSGIVAGVLLAVLTVWFCGDAVIRGGGMAPWYGLAALVLLLPLFLAFTVIPAVRANPDRLIVRNPFRTITAPWSTVESIQAGLSVELRADGKKYQVWAIPVSLRQRKRAGRRAMMAKGDQAVQESRRSRTGGADRYPVGGPGLRSRVRANPGGGTGYAESAVNSAPGAWADRSVDELRELASQAEGRPTATGQVSVVWAWWIIAPVLAGAVALAVLGFAG